MLIRVNEVAEDGVTGEHAFNDRFDVPAHLCVMGCRFSFMGCNLIEVFVHFAGPTVIRVDEAVSAAFFDGEEVSPGPPFFAGAGGAYGEEVVEGYFPLVDLFVEDFLDEGVDFLFVGEFFGGLSLGGEGADDEAEVAGNLGVVDGSLAQEAVGQGTEEGHFAFDVPAVG